MGKSGDNVGEINSGSEVWNNANRFTNEKVMDHLSFFTYLDKIAQFGTINIDEANQMTDNQINKRRVEGLLRLHSEIKMLIEDVHFALKKADHQKVEEMLKRVNTCEEFLNKSYSLKEDAIDHEELFEIDEDKFKKILTIFQDVKSKLNTPLNNAGLIFRPSEEFDLDKIMSEIIEGG